MDLLRVLVLVLLTLVGKGQSSDCNTDSDNGNIIFTARGSKNEFLVLVCTERWTNHWDWYHISISDWTATTGDVICRQLFGSSYTTATSSRESIHRESYTVTVTCRGNENRISECEREIKYGHMDYAPLIKCECAEKSIRLVDGATNREGRVEVCVDGHWGTVCGEGWGEDQASQVCWRLGFLRKGATITQFGEGTAGQVFDCSMPDGRCTPSTCTHSNDVGVRCLGFDEATSASSNSGLQAVTGLSIIALIAVVTGWIATCVYMWRKNNRVHTKPADGNSSSHHQRPLDNPVYDGSTGPVHLQTNYSSVGPAYEPVNANQGTGYDVINRGGAPRPHPPAMPTGAHNPTLDQDYSVLDHHGDEHNYHVLEAGGTGNQEHSVQRGAVQNEYETTEPQDYEIPT